ncbi:MAG: cytochrome c [Helicobacteraceae bacterium]|nr:cytochrome c [Helicobacteraceae bacterium]
MKYLLLFVFSLPLFSASSFITPMEYASQLYKNPRGIGCHHCHGEKGEGKIVANYIDKKEQKSFRAPAINEIGFKKFYRALEVRKNGMPRYFLTKKEVQSLYFYLQEMKGEK